MNKKYIFFKIVKINLLSIQINLKILKNYKKYQNNRIYNNVKNQNIKNIKNNKKLLNQLFNNI